MVSRLLIVSGRCRTHSVEVEVLGDVDGGTVEDAGAHADSEGGARRHADRQNDQHLHSANSFNLVFHNLYEHLFPKPAMMSLYFLVSFVTKCN